MASGQKITAQFNTKTDLLSSGSTQNGKEVLSPLLWVIISHSYCSLLATLPVVNIKTVLCCSQDTCSQYTHTGHHCECSLALSCPGWQHILLKNVYISHCINAAYRCCSQMFKLPMPCALTKPHTVADAGFWT